MMDKPIKQLRTVRRDVVSGGRDDGDGSRALSGGDGGGDP